MPRRTPRSHLLHALAVLLLLAACEPAPTTGSAGEARGVLTLGLLPDENAQLQRARYAPLIEAIEGKTGLEVTLTIPETYGELVSLFATAEVDAAYFGGYTFLLANKLHGAVPLVMRDIDLQFVSHVLVHRDNDSAQQLSDLRGARFSFGSRESTSGHIMPRHHFSKLGIIPEDYFSTVSFSGAHDRTIQRIADGVVDAGVANGQIVRKLLAGDRDDVPAVRVLWQSPPYVDYVWAVQPSMSDRTREAITEAFLSLSRDDELDRRFLDAIGARYFLPATSTDFDNLRSAVATIERMARTGQAR